MKIISLVLYVAAVGFGVWGFIGHSAGWAAAALSFFAATMMIVGKQKDIGLRQKPRIISRRRDHERKGYGNFERAGHP